MTVLHLFLVLGGSALVALLWALWKLSPAANCPGLPVNDQRNEG